MAPFPLEASAFYPRGNGVASATRARRRVGGPLEWELGAATVSRAVSPMRRAWAVLALAALLATPAAAQSRISFARRTPIRDSIDRVVERVVLAHLGPCQLAGREGVPCFPVAIEQEGPRFSVAEALRRYRSDGSPAPGTPTVSEIQAEMAGTPSVPQSPVRGGVGFDPVCTAKNLLKKLSGRGTTYYLYRTWDARGERPMLADHKLEAEDYRANLDFHFELLGQFDGECAAVAAWNQALRDAVDREHAPEPPPPDDSHR